VNSVARANVSAFATTEYLTDPLVAELKTDLAAGRTVDFALLNMDGPEHRQLKRRLLDREAGPETGCATATS
jgi:hypothetical protein